MTANRRQIVPLFICVHLIFICGNTLRISFAGNATQPATSQPSELDDARFSIGKLLYRDDFDKDSGQWSSELENGGAVEIAGGRLDIDVPAGATVWFKPVLHGPVLIQYEATVISAGGPNDRVSDLNCFWMARDSRNPADIFAVHRNGRFSDYNQLWTYYVGLGGNGNTTTRFRRYIGDPVQRPLRPEHDLRGSENMITANESQRIQLVACGSIIQYCRDGRRLFDVADAHPYTSGWFALRTTKNHLQVRNFRIYGLIPRPR
ncbi:MAG TPA: DUF6250 domain-containing protein [Tepidisphaeraceae bacterium]|nr:DUF6250 domain-containing protein [Tepidisphaeraceae bacterium]